MTEGRMWLRAFPVSIGARVSGPLFASQNVTVIWPFGWGSRAFRAIASSSEGYSDMSDSLTKIEVRDLKSAASACGFEPRRPYHLRKRLHGQECERGSESQNVTDAASEQRIQAFGG